MQDTFVIFDTPEENGPTEVVVFEEPREFIICRESADVGEKLTLLDKAVSSGHYAAGFLSYELGHIFLDLPLKKRSDLPLFVFGLFENCRKMPAREFIRLLSGRSVRNGFIISNGFFSRPRASYGSAVSSVKDHLLAGNTYQVNFTFKYNFDFSGSTEDFFASLYNKQPVPFAAFLEFDKRSILSLSPEMFFRKKGRDIFVRPMKGTMKRGRNFAEDRLNMRFLAESEKDRAENVMIVDLLRNDLGKVSEFGSVEPEKLFSVEKYDTLFQMTSSVRSSVRDGVSWKELFSEIFPSGSVTGAPKKRTMEIISELESEERGIYTGSIGYISPNGDAFFNVAIRTALIDRANGKGWLGIGSGIVFDSDAAKEYDECLLKGSFFTSFERKKDFSLIETILWEDGEYFLLKEHLERLENSSCQFAFPFDGKKIKARLKKEKTTFKRGAKYRVRLLLDPSGEISVSSDEMRKDAVTPVKIVISDKSTDGENIYLYHKTTKRALYDDELARYRKDGFFDVIFTNKDGEVTEGAISNIIIRKGAEYFTPPASCGLLDGVYRRHLLSSGEFLLRERILRPDDLKKADEIFLINSVRKILPASMPIAASGQKT